MVYKITCLTCSQAYIGETSTPLHIRINGHRSNVKNENVKFPSYEILHFRMHSFDNILIEILAHTEEVSKRLELENHFIIYYRTLYPYGLNTVLNNYNISNISNIYQFLNSANASTRVKRYSRGSHVNSIKINHIIPISWLTNINNIYLAICSNTIIKSKIFSLKLKTLKKIFACLNNYTFYSTHCKDLEKGRGGRGH